jgi:hypothetical protein
MSRRKVFLAVPLDFTASDTVRELGREIMAAGIFDVQSKCDSLAAMLVVRLWEWWGRSGESVRTWRGENTGKLIDACAPVDWSKEGLSYLIESSAGWLDFGARNEFGAMAVRAGVLVAAKDGLRLAGFEAMNPHLMPDYVSPQAMGGFKKGRLQKRKTGGETAEAQMPLMKPTLDAVAPLLDEVQRARVLNLIGQLDTVCLRKQRGRLEYTDVVLRDAAAIFARYDDDLVGDVIDLVADRVEGGDALDAETILGDFAAYAAATKVTSSDEN